MCDKTGCVDNDCSRCRTVRQMERMGILQPSDAEIAAWGLHWKRQAELYHAKIKMHLEANQEGLKLAHTELLKKLDAIGNYALAVEKFQKILNSI